VRILLVLTLAACSHSTKSQPTTANVDQLRTKAANYIAWGKAQAGLIDGQGFPTDDACDALERACLYMAGGAKVNYAAAEDPTTPGLWYRDSARTCGPANNTSESRFSRDMADGLGLCLWQADDTQRAKDTIAYVNANQGYIDPDAKILLGVPLAYLFETLIAKADSTPLPTAPSDPNVEDTTQTASLTTPVLSNYVAHLTEIGILWDGLMHGGVSAVEMDVLKNEAAAMPRNALFQAILHKYTDGDQSAALTVAMDETLFPNDRLPTSCDHHASYLWEWDVDSNWQPDPAPCVTWAGTDLVFLYAVVADEMRGDKQAAQ